MLRNTFIFFFISILVFQTNTIAQDKQISIEDIWVKHEFNPKRVWGLRSMKNGNYYTTIKRSKAGQELIKFNYANGDTLETIFSTTELKTEFKFSDYDFSEDESKILFTTDIENIYRHSTKENVWLFDLKSKKQTLVSVNGKQRYSSFSPDGKKIAYVRENNIYIYDIKSGKETQVTSDGKFNHIINGATDWVYEEEFAFDKAFFWAPDSKHIAYYKFDETNVKEFNMIVYKHALYPTDYKYKYPKAGEDNSLVDIYLYNLKNAESIKANFPETEYIPRIKWASANELAVQTLNRHQNDLTIHFVSAKANTSHVVYNEKSETYVEVISDWSFLPDSKQMLITSEKDGYNHIYLVNYQTGIDVQLTKGNWDVTKFYGIMHQSGMFYFQSAEVSPTQRHIYSQDIKSKTSTKLSTKNGWNDAAFSANFLFYINTHSDANTPHYITLNMQDGSELKNLVTNEKLNTKLKNYSTSKKEFFTFKTEQGTALNAWMIKPANFDPSKKHPVLITIYGGPGSQTVKDQWDYNLMWHHMLAQKGYIVVSVDNRGTGARGAEFKKSTYQQLGKLEVEDYIETAKHLGNQPYIDAGRIGIWGWSYGGYMSTLALSKGAEYFKTAIAVAPVSNWRYYDNIYTERYMRTPQENADGYDNNSPINYVNLIKGNYLLVHGTADDNVHFQNTVELVDALVDNDIQYDFYMYTDKNHSIYGGNARKHLFTKFTTFLLEKL